MTTVVRMEGMVKRFSGFCANDHINLDVQEGEILALLGENGAGKSVLMKTLAGVYQAQEGRIYVRGQQADIHSPEDAIRLGIWMIHQQFMLVPPLTALENIVAGMRLAHSPWLSLNDARGKVLKLCRDHGLAVDLDKPVWQASVGEQQRVEIVKALFRGAQILIMDEPTAVLTPQEARRLFQILRSLRAEGKTIVFISHKLDEVMSLTDRVTVLRAGRVVATVPTSQATPRELARMMVGREVLLRVKKEPQEPGPVVLEVQDIHVLGDNALPAVRGVSLQVHTGEIVGVAGVDGNGQAELAEALCGLRSPTQGHILLNGRDVTRQNPFQALDAGIGHIPADRQDGSVADLSVQENLVLDCFYRPPFARRAVLDRRAIGDHARHMMAEYDIRASSANLPAGLLSGGNLQKVIIARQFHHQPRLLIVNQPTHGLDVGATEYVHKRLLEERQRGAAILLISTEQEDILNLSDRIAVLYEGQIMGILPGANVDIEELGLLMAGSRRAGAEVSK